GGRGEAGGWWTGCGNWSACRSRRDGKCREPSGTIGPIGPIRLIGPIGPAPFLSRGDAMTEAEWLRSADPEAMLKLLKGKVSERKLRLFACACCRRIAHLLPDEPSRITLEVIERYPD